jgi:5-methylcytosine-specific restriction endonuclease McrA
MTTDAKTCTKCFRTKPLAEFAKANSRPDDASRRNVCRHCRAVYIADWKRRKGYISKAVVHREVSRRWSVLVRDNFTCQYCGAKAPEVRLEVDHFFPKSRGGENTMENLVTACLDCNRGKRDSLPPQRN